LAPAGPLAAPAGAVMPPLAAGGDSAGVEGAEGGADSGGGLPAPLLPLLPLVPVLPASLQPVSAISTSTTKAMLVSAKALEKVGAWLELLEWVE
jgi:hypothetical protein